MMRGRLWFVAAIVQKCTSHIPDVDYTLILAQPEGIFILYINKLFFMLLCYAKINHSVNNLDRKS